MGAAPVMPLTFHIDSPEKFPIHTPTVYWLEYPMHQLSLISLLVPVFTAVQNRVERGFSSPKVGLRATLSDNTSETIKDASLENIFFHDVSVSLSGTSLNLLQIPSLASMR